MLTSNLIDSGWCTQLPTKKKFTQGPQGPYVNFISILWKNMLHRWVGSWSQGFIHPWCEKEFAGPRYIMDLQGGLWGGEGAIP